MTGMAWARGATFRMGWEGVSRSRCGERRRLGRLGGVTRQLWAETGWALWWAVRAHDQRETARHDGIRGRPVKRDRGILPDVISTN